MFIDLFVMSMGNGCMGYNVGGFAKWAQLIGGKNFRCNTRAWTNGVDKKSANKAGCTWTDGTPFQVSTIKVQGRLFLPPMA